ncbi:MAG: serine/threonine protein kinase [Planctomycetes bacterium]|nr:serine/threonine protein kinase [Planctomycetota bacterium]MBI3847303.1 serine/threonine protein kinase [Planctomycetota bacterium]
MKRSAEDIYREARQLQSTERSAYLADACGTDRALRRAVDAMLDTVSDASDFVRPADATGATPLHETAGQMIGRYKLLEKIGEGGFGSVWLAEQREPVRRRVALKIIKLGMDTKQVIARFEAERQALAMMDHPHIAKVFDAGATETGRPFFVMELVKGVPILQYCDRERLDTTARLELFRSVCHAIQHAHQKGIIHRDIKPSNVLVTLHDGVAIPKVIDFGIAKATHSELTQKTLFTEHRQMIGTPAYMSPEQAEMSGQDIDTRSDIYSLGVLLYELLTGTTPFDVQALLESGFAEMMRVIREVEPHKPSTRISTLGDTATRTAEQRDVDVKKLRATLRGDLDWIVMKCLEKDRTRRYETANGLAADIQRHLNHEPVTASPPSAAYRLRKFVRRNRAQVIAGGVVAVALVLGVVGTTAGMIHALGEKQRADAEAAKATRAAESEAKAKVAAQENEQRAVAEAKRAEAAKEEEAKARNRAETITEFVTTALKASDAENRGGGQDMTILAAIDHAIADIDTGRFKDDPATEAELKSTIATILSNNGRLADAHSLAVQVLEIHRRIHPGDDPDVAASLNDVAKVDERLGRRAEAEPLMVQSLEMYQRLYQGDNEHVAALLNNLAELRESLGRAAEAEPLMVQSLEMNQRLFKGDDPSVAKALDNLAKVRESTGRLDDAEKLYVRALEMRRRLYKGDHPDLAVGLNNLAGVRANLGRDAEAEQLLSESVEMTRRLYKGDHPAVAERLSNLALVLSYNGRAAEAEPLIAEALEMNRRLFPGDHPEVAHCLFTLSSTRLALGRFAEAEPVCLESLEMHRRLFKGDHMGVAMSLMNLARVRRALGKKAEARPSFDEAVAMLRRLPEGSSELIKALCRSGSARLEDNDAAAALPELEEAVTMAEKLLPPESPQLKAYRETLEKCRAALAAKTQRATDGGNR